MTAEAKQIVERAFRILRGTEKFDLDQFAYRSEAALASFKEAVSLDPHSYDAWIGLGLSFAFWPSRFDDAFSSFTRAQRINPKRPDSYYELGRLLLRHAETNYETADPKDLERALVFFNEAARLGYEDLGDLYNVMGTTYYRLDRCREAVECFEQSAARANPDSWFPSTYFLAAKANELQGNLDEALRWYESYLRKGFQDEDVRLKIKNIKMLLENRRRAL